MPSRQSAAVDMRADASLSFAPLDAQTEPAQAIHQQLDLPKPGRVPDTRQPRRRPRLIVKAGRPDMVAASLASTGGHLGMSEYPIQISKVQAPPLREETLARDRLLDWLSVKIHRRVVLLTAEAGYGKTTLLADFTRRTRLRVLWYRLDAGDRDWVGFLAHLVAAVRLHVPDFGSATGSLLLEAVPRPSADDVMDVFFRELAELPADPTVLAFDDFHLVDDSVDIRYVVGELLARAPERVSFVFASRRSPPLRLARLRAVGEISELKTDDLRFDIAETERLFRETYDLRLEPAVLSELGARTEGWAASLELVRAAIRDRNAGQIRAFVSSLSGAEGHICDYLAEEVVGELPQSLQQFLMRTSVLDNVDPRLGSVAASVSTSVARDEIQEGVRHGLLGKSGQGERDRVRAHPLVRDFLRDRLERAIGQDGVNEIHLRVAQAAEPTDWRMAGSHYLAAGREEEARTVLGSAIDEILATGAYAAAQHLATSLTSGSLPGAPGLVLQSRLAQQRGLVGEGLDLAERAWSVDPSSTAALLNLVAARILTGDPTGAVAAGKLLEGLEASELRAFGRVYQQFARTSADGSLVDAASELSLLAIPLREGGKHHFLGVTLCMEALARLPMADATGALAAADEAISVLASSSGVVELVSARLARASALAQIGDIAAARLELSLALAAAPGAQRLDVATEAAEVEEFFGDQSAALGYLASVEERVAEDRDNGEQALLARAIVRAHQGEFHEATADLGQITAGILRSTAAFELRRLLATTLVAVLSQHAGAIDLARQAIALATRQGALLWGEYARVIRSAARETQDPSPTILTVATTTPVTLSMAAEAIINRLADLSPDALNVVRAEVRARPWRWLSPTRRAAAGDGPSRFLAASFLEDIGEHQDVGLLRKLARGSRDGRRAALGKRLARRIAPKVIVEDLGRIHVVVEGHVIEGAEVRRKVLALLCFLLTRPRWTATREEVVDSLWPDIDPQAALNSLNQTVYFLRRVFEPDYAEDTSPGYVQQDGEIMWLDPELIEARSRRCGALIRGISGEPDPDSSVLLVTEYRGRFALDFAYEEWAGAFRDSLHAAYLRVVESAIRLDINSGNYIRGSFLAERASEVEPESEELLLALVRIYRLAGAHAAAAEQYAHYTRAMEDLGVEPKQIADL